jgi:AbiU2
MNTDDQVKEKMDGIMQLIAEIDFNVNTLEQFHNELSSDELTMFDKYELLNVLRHYLWESSILDLCKLFVENEKFSFNCLLNILVNNYKRISFKSPIEINEIKKFYNLLTESAAYIKHIKEARDLDIAHKDNKNTFDPILITELKTLINLAKNIFNTIFGALNNSTFLWINTDDKRAIYLIKDIAKYDIIQNLVYRTDLSKKMEISTFDLLKIIDEHYFRH